MLGVTGWFRLIVYIYVVYTHLISHHRTTAEEEAKAAHDALKTKLEALTNAAVRMPHSSICQCNTPHFPFFINPPTPQRQGEASKGVMDLLCAISSQAGVVKSDLSKARTALLALDVALAGAYACMYVCSCGV